MKNIDFSIDSNDKNYLSKRAKIFQYGLGSLPITSGSIIIYKFLNLQVMLH